jgi:hypothetical protein
MIIRDLADVHVLLAGKLANSWFNPSDIVG